MNPRGPSRSVHFHVLIFVTARVFRVALADVAVANSRFLSNDARFVTSAAASVSAALAAESFVAGDESLDLRAGQVHSASGTIQVHLKFSILFVSWNHEWDGLKS